jgi:hypothetical protein
MLEALWSVKFRAAGTGDFGHGVVVLETGRVLGGDSEYMYVGSYRVGEGGRFLARLEVKHYGQFPISIFGPVKQFVLDVSGVPARDQFSAQGVMVGRPDLRLELELTRRAELP